MAGKDDETVEVLDEGVVTVDLGDVEVPDKEQEPVVEVVTDKKPLPRVKLDDQRAIEPKADEALAALQQTVKNEQTARAAAEATANAERLKAQQAERLAQQREQEARDARESADSSELALITTGVDNATRELSSAEEELERAMESGDFKKSAAAQVKVSRAAAALDRLETAKASYEAGGGRKTTEGRVEAQPVQQQGSAFEHYVSSFAPEAQTWLRAHPECVPANVGGNATSNAKMMKGHYAALAEGLTPNSVDYFRVIEETAGYRQPVSAAANVKEAGSDDEADAPVPKPKPAVRKAQPSAPVTREAPATGAGRNVRTVSLTRDQQDAAKMSFPQLPTQQAYAQYAKNLVELEAEGKMGRLTH